MDSLAFSTIHGKRRDHFVSDFQARVQSRSAVGVLPETGAKSNNLPNKFMATSVPVRSRFVDSR